MTKAIDNYKKDYQSKYLEASNEWLNFFNGRYEDYFDTVQQEELIYIVYILIYR